MASGSDFNGPPVAAPAGEAGQTFLSSLLDNPLDSAGAQRLNEGAQKFKTMAQNGSFAINEEGFRAYERVCNEFLDGYSSMQQRLYHLSTRAKMGSSDYARKIADFNVQVASGEPKEQSLIHNLELLKDGFVQVRDALAIARKNYNQTEDAHRQTFANGFGTNS